MKKTLASLLAVSMLLTLAACGGQAASAPAAASEPETASAQEDAPQEELAAPQEAETSAELPAPEPAEEASAAEPEPEPEPEGPPALELPLADHDVTLSAFWSYPPWLTNFIEAQDKPTFVALSEATGVDLDILGVSLFNASEQFALMVASSDYTDIVADFGMQYTGTYDQAIEDEIIYDLKDIIDEHCPNYYGIIHSDDSIYKAVVTNNGNIPAFLTINDENVYIRGGYWINTDMLAQIGADMPETYDQWHDVLVSFRDQLGADGALWIDSYATSADLTSGYGVKADFYQEDGQVKFGFIEDGMKEYLTMMNEWYADGLIYHDFYSQMAGADKPDPSLVDGGTSGIWHNAANSFGEYSVASSAISQPILKAGDVNHFSERSDRVQAGADWAITTNCANPEIAAMMLDYLYSEEGIMLTNYGIEGVSYELVNGEPVYTELLTNNPDMSFNQALAIYALFNTAGIYNVNTRMDVTYSEEQIASREIWAAHNDTANNYPSAASMTIEESEKFYGTYNDIDTYIDENLLAFIIGTTPLSEFDSFKETLISMGIEDCIAIKQDALDRYNAR
ncbi:MAG: extracellular solute-binding protein [Oscillospiraceae bacterium]|nr:extracellular solute-binding protein [Oscillospiraceae bacterium]